MEALSIEIYFCHNNKCPDYGKAAQGNMHFKGWSGKQKDIRLVHCTTCHRTFSSRKGTVLENSKVSTAQALSILEHLTECTGTRATSRLCRVSTNTVTRLAKKTGHHAERLHDMKVPFSPSNQGSTTR